MIHNQGTNGVLSYTHAHTHTNIHIHTYTQDDNSLTNKAALSAKPLYLRVENVR